MVYNHAKAYKKWLILKEKEKQLLREAGVDEKTIKELRNYDYNDFLLDRRYQENEQIVKSSFFIPIPVYDSSDVNTVEKMLDKVDDNVVYYILKSSDKVLLDILYLLFQGYSVKEIGEELELSPNAIYKKLSRLRKKLK